MDPGPIPTNHSRVNSGTKLSCYIPELEWSWFWMSSSSSHHCIDETVRNFYELPFYVCI